jgi:hypothetical protein
MVTAYVPGPSLRDAVTMVGPLPVDAVQTLGACLAEGLAAIHACGLVHRDVKPENVILAPDGPRVIDFGIARALDAKAMTAHGAVLGTYSYMSPEQARGLAVEPAGDVFSLGSVLAFAATGRSPFGIGPEVVVLQHIASEPADLTGVPASLRGLVAACLEKNPAERLTVTEILDRLTAADTSRRWPPPAIVDIINSRGSEPDVASGAMAREGDSKHYHSTLEPPARSHLPGDPDPANQPHGAQRPIRRRTILLSGLGTAAAAAIPVGVLVTDSAKHPRSASRGTAGPAAPDPNVLAGHTGLVNAVAFSRDGKALASGSADHTIRLWDLASRRTSATLAAHSDAVTSVAFSPDWKTLASGSADHTVRLWDLASRRTSATLAAHSNAVTSVAFAPEGGLLASGGADRTARLWIVASRRNTATLSDRPAAVNSVIFGPDGSVLMIANADNTVDFWQTTNTHQKPGVLTLRDITSVSSLALTPKVIAIGASPGWVSLWDGKKSVPPPLRITNPVNAVAFHPDDKTLAVGMSDGTILLWNTRTHQRIGAPLTGHRDAVTSVAFSLDGKLLASGSADHTIRLWNT